MVELTISKRDNEVSRYSFDSGSITIGRSPENEVYLNSPSVSPEHARLSLLDGICSIQNLASKGGTFINNLEIKRAQLYDKDVIRIGHYSIEFSIDRKQQPEALKQVAVEGADAVPKPVGPPVPEPRPTRESDANVAPSNRGTQGTSINRELPTERTEKTAGAYAERAEPTAPSFPAAAEEQSQDKVTASQVEDGKARTDSDDAGEPQPIENVVAGGNLPPLHGTGIDVLSGPAEGKRVYFTRDRAALGIKDVTAVVIKSAQEGYVAQAPNEDIVVTLNGSVIADNPVSLDSGDLIAFGSLKARFFIEAPAE